MTANAGERYDRMVTHWGQGTEMTAYEAAVWHVSDRPILRAASVVVELLDVTPPWERLRKGHAWALGRVPRLRQRVVSDPVRFGPPAWADTQVDLDHHLRRVQVRAGGDLDDVLAVARAMHEEVFDPDRPLWLAALVEGLPRGQSAYILKFHHAMADDEALVALFELLHSYVREPTVSVPQLPAGHHESCSPLRLTTRHALQAVHRTPRSAAKLAAATVHAGAVALLDPAGSSGRSLAAGRFLQRELNSFRFRPSPLIRHRGPHRLLDAIDLRSKQLLAVAGGSARLGDVTLAAAVSGLAKYHAELGMPVSELAVGVPLRLRFDGSGERVPRAHIMVPTKPMPTAKRIALMRRLSTEAESVPHIDLLRAAAPLLSRSPTLLLGRMFERAMRPFAAQTFVVPGLQRDAYLAGAKVLRMFSFAPTSGCALSMTHVTHQEWSCIGFNYDTTAIAEPELMGRCMREALSETLGAVSEDAAPQRRRSRS